MLVPHRPVRSTTAVSNSLADLIAEAHAKFNEARRGGRVKTAQRPTGRAKSNSERGREFRFKQAKAESELEATVAQLRRHVEELDRARSLFAGRSLHTARFTDSGALARLIHEYFTLFRHGLRDVSSTTTSRKRPIQDGQRLIQEVQRKEAFLHAIIDADAIVGDFRGPEATIQQWWRYTASHDNVVAEILAVTATGTQDHPVVVLKSQMRARISHNTFRLMFPHALHRLDLQEKFIGREVTYPCLFRFAFTPEGTIASETVNFDFVQGLVMAGCSLDDVAELMRASILTPHELIPEPIVVVNTGESLSSKLSVEYLLE